MKAEKDKKTGKWLIQYRYTDWQGKRRKSTKRGFATKREAEEWLRNFLIKYQSDRLSLEIRRFHERSAWGLKKSEMENQQRKKNKSKNREMER